MSKNKKSIRLGIYLCDCEGKLKKLIDLNKVKNVIQGKADFEYIRVASMLCGKQEQEKLLQEIDKYSLNRLLIAGCTDANIMRHIIKLAESKGVSRYEVEFVDLTSPGRDNTKGAIDTISGILSQLQNRSEINIEELDVLPDVLVVGCGAEGAAAALAIGENQPVMIIDNGGPKDGLSLVQENKNIIAKTGVKVVGLEGFPGQFTVRFFDNGNYTKQSFGAIVLALGAQPVYDSSKYDGIELGERIITLSQFLESKRDFAGQKIAFLLGKADKDSLLSYSHVLSQAIVLKEQGAAEVSILYEDMKVSADRLEQEYEQARARGINFLKYSGDLRILSTAVAATVRYREPFLTQLEPIRLTTDYLVLAEDYVPAPSTAELADALDVRLGPDGFFQDDNVHFLPIKSNREGIYFVGSCHGPLYGVELKREIAAVRAEVGKFASGKVRVPALQPRVTAEKCAVCLTCYRCCPHHAIEIVHDESLNNMYHSAARMNPLACRRCGICAGECPGKAIQLPFYSDQEMLMQISNPPKLVAFACENSGALAAEFAKKLEPNLQDNLQIVSVPCSGKIDALYLLKALERGADGVLLLVCHEHNCKFICGNDRADKRKEQVRRRLSEIGLEDERVEIVHLAANQGNEFNDKVRTMAARIHQLGTNPGKVIK
jgi:coenzyme F420-reducing hydrogenase delta subunit/Pyruvate/2-oxoacid:ferredoxin oxidoreductase delta subunit